MLSFNLYTVSLISLTLLFVLVLYYYRRPLLAVLHTHSLSSFSSQRDAGLTSSLFDIESNLADGDSREGLDAAGAEEVRRIMRREGISFDEARLIRHKMVLARNGVDPTGMPTDPKAITRL